MSRPLLLYLDSTSEAGFDIMLENESVSGPGFVVDQVWWQEVDKDGSLIVVMPPSKFLDSAVLSFLRIMIFRAPCVASPISNPLLRPKMRFRHM